MANFIYQQGLATDILVAGSTGKIAIGVFNGKVNIYNAPAPPGPGQPKSYGFLQSLEAGQVVLGTYANDTYFRLAMTEAGSCEWVVGTAPVLTSAPISAAQGLVLGYTDSSGTPGAATTITPRGRAAIAASASSAVITNALVLATSTVLINLKTVDATATRLTVAASAGSFTVTANAGATGTTVFDYVIIN